MTLNPPPSPSLSLPLSTLPVHPCLPARPKFGFNHNCISITAGAENCRLLEECVLRAIYQPALILNANGIEMGWVGIGDVRGMLGRLKGPRTQPAKNKKKCINQKNWQRGMRCGRFQQVPCRWMSPVDGGVIIRRSEMRMWAEPPGRVSRPPMRGLNDLMAVIQLTHTFICVCVCGLI